MTVLIVITSIEVKRLGFIHIFILFTVQTQQFFVLFFLVAG